MANDLAKKTTTTFIKNMWDYTDPYETNLAHHYNSCVCLLAVSHEHTELLLSSLGTRNEVNQISEENWKS